MKKLFSLLFILLLLPIHNPIYANEVDVTSDYVLLYNLNDEEVIYEQNSNEKVNIASLTKIMTALVTIENCDNLDEKVLIENRFFTGLEEYSMAGFPVGSKLTVRDLLYGVLLPSGAEACNAVAYHVGKTMDGFIQLMNNKAKELNLKNTKFDNPIGMDSKNNYSSANDLSVLLRYALKNETFKEIFCTRVHKIPSLNKKLYSTIIGYSKSFGIDTSQILGSKTGYTSGAGYCLASISTINNIDYMLIVLNADTDLRCNAVLDTIEIYDYFSQNYGYHTVISKDQTLHQLPIKCGFDEEYIIQSNEEINKYLKNDFNKKDIQLKYEGVEEIDYTIKYKDKLGTIQIIYKDKVIEVIDVYLDKELKFIDPIFIGIVVISLIILFIFIYLKRKNRVK